MENQKFTILLELNYVNLETLEKEELYIFLGKDWLVTIHSSKIKLSENMSKFVKHKNQIIQSSSVNELYLYILFLIIDNYQRLLTAIELATIDFGKKAIRSCSSKKILVNVDTLSTQIISLRRYFWQTRDIVTFLLNTINRENEETNNEDIKFLKTLYNDVDQLMNLVDSHKDTINSIRELYIANVSLQLNDTVKTLTIFSVVLLPLTFITSLYGMNGLDLNHIWNIPTGLGIVLIIMVIMIIGLVIFFKTKGWILVKDSLINEEKEKTTKKQVE